MAAESIVDMPQSCQISCVGFAENYSTLEAAYTTMRRASNVSLIANSQLVARCRLFWLQRQRMRQEAHVCSAPNRQGPTPIGPVSSGWSGCPAPQSSKLCTCFIASRQCQMCIITPLFQETTSQPWLLVDTHWVLFCIRHMPLHIPCLRESATDTACEHVTCSHMMRHATAHGSHTWSVPLTTRSYSDVIQSEVPSTGKPSKCSLLPRCLLNVQLNQVRPARGTILRWASQMHAPLACCPCSLRAVSVQASENDKHA